MINKTLVKLYEEHVGKVSDKWPIYLNEYDRILNMYRNKPVCLLEIGVQNGGSLEIWSKYFPHAKKLVGCDINPYCSGLSYEDSRVAVVVGDINSDATQTNILRYASTFDVIVDDGSHHSSDIVKSFARYFPCLTDDGVFIVEDLHCSYWKDFEGGLFDPFSAITFFKHLTDVINQEYWGIDKNRTDILSGFFTKYSFKIDEEILQHIFSVEFINSMCVIRKCKPEHNQQGTRVIAGSEGTVIPRHTICSSLEIPDQTCNVWTARSMPPDEEVLLCIKKLSERDGQIVDLNQTVIDRNRQITNFNQTVIKRDRQITNFNQTVIKRDRQIADLNQTVIDRNRQITKLYNSISWRITQPFRTFGKTFPLGKIGRRAAKYVWWAVTLQLARRLRERKMSKSIGKNRIPHFAQLSDDCCFVVPFNYPMKKLAIKPSVAVICHVYYIELFEECKQYISNIPFPFDLFITTDTEQKKIDIANTLLDWNRGSVEIRLVPNRGRNIAPKLITCLDVFDHYEFFLHIHSKKSLHSGLLAGWRSYLLETLLGSKEIVESIFEAFDSDHKLGMIAPQHFGVIEDSIGWGWNFDAAKKLANSLGLKLSLDGKIDFPSGAMFWGRSKAIKPLLEMHLSIEDFAVESGKLDGELGHVIERLYFFVCEQSGHRWIKIGCPILLKNIERVIFVESKDSLACFIKESQYGLLASQKIISNSLVPANISSNHARNITQIWRLAHTKSDLQMLNFSQFHDELKKHISKQESKINFDEDFYLEANPDIAKRVARGELSCGYVHYCLHGQYEGRRWSDRQLMHRFLIKSSYAGGFLAPTDCPPMIRSQINLSRLPQSHESTLLILFHYLQEDLFFAGYHEFLNDYGPVFDRFDRIVIAVEHAKFDRKVALRYSSRIEVMHISEIDSLKYQPDIIVGFNAHMTCTALQMLPDNPERIVYYCQEYESGFFPYGADYIIGEKAVAGSHNLIVSTNILREFLEHKGLITDQQVFTSHPKIELFHVSKVKTNQLFFYYRPESFHKRNLSETLMQVALEFCHKYSGYEIFMVGSVATSYSFKINGTQIYVINKLPYKDYIKLISSCDVVISMIYSAHPGVIAFQTAASGVPTITNVFENRDASLLKKISKNIVPYDPVRDDLLAAIEQAVGMPKGQTSFNEELYSGKQQGSFVDFHDNILLSKIL